MQGKNHGRDLIDTQWNVNTILVSLADNVDFDLIDTQWNVNQGEPNLPNINIAI